jgi:hypothetical protein
MEFKNPAGIPNGILGILLENPWKTESFITVNLLRADVAQDGQNRKYESIV